MGAQGKNHIPLLQGPNGVVTDHESKALILFEHFKDQMGTNSSMERRLNWNFLRMPCLELQPLEEVFTVEELHFEVQELQAEKVPGPDGFIGGFFKSCWNVNAMKKRKSSHSLHALCGTFGKREIEEFLTKKLSLIPTFVHYV